MHISLHKAITHAHTLYTPNMIGNRKKGLLRGLPKTIIAAVGLKISATFHSGDCLYQTNVQLYALFQALTTSGETTTTVSNIGLVQ